MLVQDVDIQNISINYSNSSSIKHYNTINTFSQEKNKDYFYFPTTTLKPKVELFLRDLAIELDLELSLILSLIELETGGKFNNEVVSVNPTSIDIGLFQLNNKWGVPNAEEILDCEVDPYDVYDNISGGLAILYNNREYYRSQGYTGDSLMNMTLLSYNRGIGGASIWMETHNDYHAYVHIIRDNQHKWQELVNRMGEPTHLLKF